METVCEGISNPKKNFVTMKCYNIDFQQYYVKYMHRSFNLTFWIQNAAFLFFNVHFIAVQLM